MPTLIVNADNFGMTAGVNEGIAGPHAQGILTSTSLMVDGPAAEQAVTFTREHPQLSEGLHFVDENRELDEPRDAAREFAAQLGVPLRGRRARPVPRRLYAHPAPGVVELDRIRERETELQVRTDPGLPAENRGARMDPGQLPRLARVRPDDG